MNSIEFPEMNYKHFREKNAKFHIFLLLSIMGGISLITIYDRKFRHNRPEEGLPKMITYISPINMVAEDNHLYFAYKSPLGTLPKVRKNSNFTRNCYFGEIFNLHSTSCSDARNTKIDASGERHGTKKQRTKRGN